jgi:hypothetical protein
MVAGEASAAAPRSNTEIVSARTQSQTLSSVRHCQILRVRSLAHEHCGAKDNSKKKRKKTDRDAREQFEILHSAKFLEAFAVRVVAVRQLPAHVPRPREERQCIDRPTDRQAGRQAGGRAGGGAGRQAGRQRLKV